jgi:hypothetical protein
LIKKKEFAGENIFFRGFLLHGSHSYRLSVELIHIGKFHKWEHVLTKESPYYSKISLKDNFVAGRLPPTFLAVTLLLSNPRLVTSPKNKNKVILRLLHFS